MTKRSSKSIKPARRISTPVVRRKPKLRTLTASNTVERFRMEKNSRKKTKKGFMIVGVFAIVVCIVYAWKMNLASGVTAKFGKSAVAVREKIISLFPVKSLVKAEPKIDAIKKTSMIASLRKKIPIDFINGKNEIKYATPVILLELKGFLYPVGLDLFIQPGTDRYLDLPLVSIADSNMTVDGQIFHKGRFVVDLIDVLEKRSPETARSIAVVKIVDGGARAVLAFADSPIRFTIAPENKICEQADNIALVRSSMSPELKASVNLEHSGIAFVTMEE